MSQRGECTPLVVNRAAIGILNWPAKGPCMVKGIFFSNFHTGFVQLYSLCQKQNIRLEYYSEDKLLVLCGVPSSVHESGLAWLDSEIRRMQKVGFIMEEHWYGFITRPTSVDPADFKGIHEESTYQISRLLSSSHVRVSLKTLLL